MRGRLLLSFSFFHGTIKDKMSSVQRKDDEIE